jgi:nucleotide-binding universal stress UspA family protein
MDNIESIQHKRVVVGVDGSPNSVTALHHAAQAALRLGTDLDIVLALETQADEATLADAARRLDELVSREFPGGLGAPSRREVEPGAIPSRDAWKTRAARLRSAPTSRRRRRDRPRNSTAEK